MKSIILLFMIVLFVISSQVRADEVDNTGNKGVVTGRILDNSNLPLPGATIVVKSINKGVVSDVNGYYRLTLLKAGTHEIIVSYIGFKPQSKNVTVAEGKTEVVDFNLTAGIDIDEVVVNGALQGQSKALNQQKNNINISNIISSDQVTRFPDANIGDALKRIPGSCKTANLL
ncbi:MAG: carboxypeptidase-like regulatory domain-containing protein [Prolixibacteraceae bacterium]|jgi:hypothetical protein